MNKYRSHKCDELDKKDVGKNVAEQTDGPTDGRTDTVNHRNSSTVKNKK